MNKAELSRFTGDVTDAEVERARIVLARYLPPVESLDVAKQHLWSPNRTLAVMGAIYVLQARMRQVVEQVEAALAAANRKRSIQ